MKYHIEDNIWKQIHNFLKTCKGIHTNHEGNVRNFIEAVWYMARGGCQWRLLPSYYGCCHAIHQRFRRWGKREIWQRLFEYCQDHPDLEAVMVDATIIRAHACAAGYEKDSQDREALGRSKGGFTTKIHALVDALGNPLRFLLTPGQRNDITQAENLTQGIMDTMVIADKGYDSNAFIEILEDRRCNSTIPPRSNRKKPRYYDEHVYKERHLIECFFGKIKHYRRIFSRFDKTGESFMAFLQFVGALIWLR